MALLLNQTNLVVSLGFLGDPVASAGTVSPGVTGADTSIFMNSSFRQGVVPPITENEWMEAWSAVVEFAVLFRAPFLSQATSISPWGWVIPPDFEEQSTDSEARLWVPSVRQISRFLLRDFISEAPNAPTTPGGWVRLMETYLSGVIKEDAYVPFTSQLLRKYNVPITEISLTPPEVIGALFQAGDGGFLGSFVLYQSDNAPHDVTLLEDRAGNNIEGLTTTIFRSMFVPSFSSNGLVTLLNLGLTSQLTSLLESSWVPAADPEVHLAPESTSLDLAITDDSILRMAFGGEAPSDAVFEGLLRGTVTAPATINAPFMSSPLSLLFFAKSLIWNIASILTYQDAENPSHSYGKAQFATDVPADPEVPGSEPSVRYSPATVRIPGRRKVFMDEYQKYNQTGYYVYDSTTRSCPAAEGAQPPPPIVVHTEEDLDDPGNYEEGDSGAAYWDSLSALYDEVSTTGDVSTTEYARTFEVTLYTRVEELTASYPSASASSHVIECVYGGAVTSTSASDRLEEYDNAHKICDALGDIPMEVFPASVTPWTSTIFDLLKGTIGEDELAFLVGNDLLGTVRLYISVWCPEMSANSGGQTVTYTTTHEFHRVDGQPPESSDPGEVTEVVVEPGYPTTPIGSAQLLLDPIIASTSFSVVPLLPSDALAQCENGAGEFFDEDQSLPIDNSISVGGFGTFAHRSILLWEGEDLQESVSEAGLWGTIVAETGLMAGATAIVGLPPSVSKETEAVRLTASSSDSGVWGSSSSSSSQTKDYTSTITKGGARFQFAVGDIYFKIDYNFTHYRNPPT